MGYETTNYEGIYSGGYSSLNPDYGNFVGYRMSASKLGAPTSAQTANQISEVATRIREGMKVVEVGAISPDVFEQIPKEHFKEIAALTKLAGVKPSIHAPIIDPAGFGQRGYEGEMARLEAERHLFSVMEKSHELDPNGNVPVVIHSTGGVPGTQYAPEKGKMPGEEGRFREKKIILINQETKEMVPLEEEKRYRLPLHPEDQFKKEGKIEPPREYIHSVNANEWINKLSNIDFYKQRAQQSIGSSMAVLGEDLAKPATQEFINSLSGKEKQAYSQLHEADISIENIRMTLNSAFDRAYKYGTEEQREQLTELAEEHKKELAELYKDGVPIIGSPIRSLQIYDDTTKKLFNLTKGEAPEIYKPVEEFAMEKSAETFGNVAFKTYQKFGDGAPVMAIENMFQGMAFSRAEDMEKLVNEARKKFVDNAVDDGMSKKEAESTAKKLIGVTWDVGHLNMMRKEGFTEEDVIKETEKIAKMVKHVHLTDNFGYSDSHLAPGMGNVPFKQILEQLEKAGVLDKARKIVEAPGFVQHFKTSPHPLVLSAFGSPIYGGAGAPYFNQAKGLMGNYFSSPLAYLPEQHFSMYGSGFSSLPMEVGGQIPGTRSRFSGTENA